MQETNHIVPAASHGAGSRENLRGRIVAAPLSELSATRRSAGAAGFTLIELLIAISIIAILSVIGLGIYQS